MDARRIRQPAVLVLTAWLLCFATALFSSRPEQSNPTPRAPSPSQVFDHGPFEYLSDLPVFDMRSGPWPIVKNGLIGDGGKTILVAGTSSPKGIGMHPPDSGDAIVKFRLYGEAARFKAKAALDDTSVNPGSPVVFEVLGNGKPLWKSEEIAKAGQAKECDLDVTGVDVLELHTRATGRSQNLHAVWVEPRILQRAETPDKPPPFKLFENGPREFLSDLPEFGVEIGPITFCKNGDWGNNIRIKVNGQESPHGLGMHPPTTGYACAKYHLHKQAAIFKTSTAINDDHPPGVIIGSCHFEVRGDGVLLWKSNTINAAKVTQSCQVDVTGVDVLELRVADADIVNTGVWAVWVEPRVLQTADAPDPGITFEHFRNGAREFLSEMPENVIKTGPFPFAKNGEIGDGRTKIKVKGVLSPKGLGMVPPDNGFSAVSYRLDKKAAVFKASVAIDDSSNLARNPAVFEVLGDGKSLWESQPIDRGTPPEECSINVSGIVELELRVHAKPSHFGLWAVWIEPRLLKSADTPDQ
jgi:hypothetical protein